jgi:hypothetical protein
MAVLGGRRSMCSPTGVCDGHLGNEGLVDVDGGGCDLLAKTSDFSDFFEVYNFAGLIAIGSQTSRVVTTIFLTGETTTEDFQNLLATLVISTLAIIASDGERDRDVRGNRATSKLTFSFR